MEKTVSNSSGNSFQIIESVWTGKSKILVDGNPTKKLNRKSFSYESDDQTYSIKLTGNSLFGMSLDVNGETIEVLKKLHPLEIIVSLIPVILVFLGGALGGLIGAGAIIINLSVMRNTDKILIKIIEPLAVSVAAYYLYLLIATYIWSAINL